MKNFGRALVYSTAALGLVVFGACSNSGDGAPVEPYGGANGTGAVGGINGGQGGLGAIGGQGALGGLAGTSGGGPGGSGGAGGGPQPRLIDQCPGSLDPAAAQALKAGGAPGSMRWLYPYDQTVFPRGILPPVLQWEGAAAQAVYIHIKSQAFEYHGCFGPTNPLRIPLPVDVWEALTANILLGAQDPATVEITTASGGAVAGPIREQWVIAPASLKGAIYYNTYGSPQAANNGAVMRIVPGQARPEVYLSDTGLAPLGPCKSCHSLSANGRSMVLARHAYPAGPYESLTYDVGANPQPNPPPIPAAAPIDAAGFAAVYPDGSRFMTMGSPGTTPVPAIPFPLGPGNVPAMEGPRDSRLFQINGTPIPTPTWTVRWANMPTFSPTGDKLVFNHYDTGQGRSLAIINFNAANNSFSNLVELYKHDTLYPGWPFVTPGGEGVVFVLGDAADYVSSHPARIFAAKSDLMYIDIASKRAVRMDRAGGFNGNTPYVPAGERDVHREFFPTVSPVAAGGYYWVFFTSRRTYGNIMTKPVDDVGTKQIWVAAIDINAPAGVDPSHPAFYLPGQEEGSGNVRAFAALEPCKQDGAQCSTGVECCCGGCTDTGQCGCPEGCSNIDEKCTTAADCCSPTAQCINGFCALVPQ
jgi:hypothetical protein